MGGKNWFTQSGVASFVSSSHEIQQGFQREAARWKQMRSRLLLPLLNIGCFQLKLRVREAGDPLKFRGAGLT